MTLKKKKKKKKQTLKGIESDSQICLLTVKTLIGCGLSGRADCCAVSVLQERTSVPVGRCGRLAQVCGERFDIASVFDCCVIVIVGVFVVFVVVA